MLGFFWGVQLIIYGSNPLVYLTTSSQIKEVVPLPSPPSCCSSCPDRKRGAEEGNGRRSTLKVLFVKPAQPLTAGGQQREGEKKIFEPTVNISSGLKVIH